MKEKKSIYEHIEESIKRNGTIDSTFNLDDYIYNEEEPFYELGVRDSIAIIEDVKKPNKRLLKLMYDILQSLDEMSINDEFERLEMYFSTKEAKEERIINTIEEIIDLIEQQSDTVDADSLYKLATILITKSKQVELVKMGIAIWATTEIEMDDPILEILLKAALCEEFTFFVSVTLNAMKEANDLRFRLVKKLSGWGKISLIHELRVDDEEKKQWLITSGCDNEISYARLAQEVADKIDLLDVLKREKLTEDEFSGICKIIEGLIITHPDLAIDKAYDNYMEILTAFLDKLEGFKYNIEFLKIALLITTFLTNKAENSEAEINLILYISNLFAEGEVFDIVDDKIKNGTPEDVVICTSILSYYGNLELYDDIYTRFKENPFDFSFCFGYLMKRKDSRDKVVKLLESSIDDSKITLDIQPLQVVDDEYYENLKTAIYCLFPFPFKAEKLIVAGLKCRVMGPREVAITILETWKAQSKCSVEDFPEQIYKALFELRQKEVVKSFKERINALFDFDEDLTDYKDPKVIYRVERVVNIEKDIDDLFEERVIFRGNDYFRDGMVYNLTKTEDRYIAYVQGSSFVREYKVDIYTDVQGNIKKMECNCPYERNCKHEYATLLTIRKKYFGK